MEWGGYGIRPYGGDLKDFVNMVWHNDKFMQFWVQMVITIPVGNNHILRFASYFQYIIVAPLPN